MHKLILRVCTALTMKQLTYKAVIHLYSVVRTELADLPYRASVVFCCDELFNIKAK